jgi:type I restriction enzyme S subunit
MQSVSEETASITVHETRTFAEVKRGYTPFREEDVLFAKITPCMENGKIAIARRLTNGIGFGSTEFHVLRAGPAVLPEYLYYYLRQESLRAAAKQHMRGGAGQQRVPEDFLRKEPLHLPPLSEQRRIVEILDQADRLRRLRAEAEAKADRILPALFIKMFGDPATNPMGWPVGTLRSFGNSVRYGLGQPPKPADDGIPLIRATNIRTGHITRAGLMFVDPSDVPTSRDAILSAEDVIVVRSGAYTGDVAQVTDEWAGAVVGYDLVVRPADGWTGEFIESYLLSSFVQSGYFAGQKSRAGQPHLNARQLEDTPVYCPPPELQRRFSAIVAEVRRRRRQSEQGAEYLKAIFATILSEAFNGSLTASWREAHMKELLQEMEQQARLLSEARPC